jgi:RND superfamily putative drug exporter
MDTFLVRSLLVPSTVSLLGRWNWWPGKLAEMDLADAGAPGDEDLTRSVPSQRAEILPTPD